MESVNEKHIQMIELDVVLAEKGACRDASRGALTAFGFQSSRIHEVEDVHSAVEEVKELYEKKGLCEKVPVVVVLPSQECLNFSQQRLGCPYFLVSTSESATAVTQVSVGEGDSCHCQVPQTLDGALLSTCSKIFQTWWLAECAKAQRMNKFHESAARKRQARLGLSLPAASFRTLPAASFQPAVDQQATVPQLQHPPLLDGAPGNPEVPLPVTQPLPPVMESPVSVHNMPSCYSSSAASTSNRGNQLSSLGLLLPARSPFEEIHIVGRAGRGSFATVYKACWDASTVALKVIQHKNDTDGTRAMFEGSLTATLAHPNLVQTYKHSIRELISSGTSAKGIEVWIVQEWCGLGTLCENAASQKLLKHGDWCCVVETSCEIASAASYLHSRGIVHGDLSGNNVMFAVGSCAKGFVSKVCDFGMARVLGDSASLETQSMGTVSSMPPELFVLEGAALTKQVDVYAFGILLWTLFSNQVPFSGLEAPMIVILVSRGKTLEVPPSTPEDIAELYRKTIARVPTHRPGFETIVHDLLKIMNNEEQMT